MKDCTTCKYGFVDEQFGILMCHHPLRFSKDCVDFNMHEEKEEPKKSAIKDGGNGITDSLSIVATIKIEWEDK